MSAAQVMHKIEPKPETPGLLLKLVEVMGAVDHVEKSGKNVAQGYSYMRATDLMHAVRKELASRKVLMATSVTSQDRWEGTTQKGGVMYYCSLVLEFSFHDAETGETLGPLRAIGWGSDTGDKAPYKALTGALKYALRAQFLIPDDSDPESDKGEQPATTPKTNPKSTDSPKPTPPVNTGLRLTEAQMAAYQGEQLPTKEGEEATLLIKVTGCVEGNTHAQRLVNFHTYYDNFDHRAGCFKPRLNEVLDQQVGIPNITVKVKRVVAKGKSYLNIEDIVGPGAPQSAVAATEITDADYVPF